MSDTNIPHEPAIDAEEQYDPTSPYYDPNAAYVDAIHNLAKLMSIDKEDEELEHGEGARLNKEVKQLRKQLTTAEQKLNRLRKVLEK
jgi:hypothetical protein